MLITNGTLSRFNVVLPPVIEVGMEVVAALVLMVMPLAIDVAAARLLLLLLLGMEVVAAVEVKVVSVLLYMVVETVVEVFGTADDSRHPEPAAPPAVTLVVHLLHPPPEIAEHSAQSAWVLGPQHLFPRQSPEAQSKSIEQLPPGTTLQDDDSDDVVM